MAGVAGLLKKLVPPNKLDAGVALAAAPPPEAAGVEAGAAAGVFEKAPPKALGFGAADASPAGFGVDPNSPPPAVPPDAAGWLKKLDVGCVVVVLPAGFGRPKALPPAGAAVVVEVEFVPLPNRPPLAGVVEVLVEAAAKAFGFAAYAPNGLGAPLLVAPDAPPPARKLFPWPNALMMALFPVEIQAR